MQFVTEFRDPNVAKELIADIARAADTGREYRFMEFCGGHTHVLSRWGLTGILPSNVHMIHGPGCPVCVLPIARIELAIELALKHKVILCTYGDTLRVPAAKGRSLFGCRAEGGDVRMVYSPSDALTIARENPDREVVFFAIGFETTTPPSAVVVKAAQKAGLKNFSLLASHVLTPAAMEHILKTAPERSAAPKLNGLVGPAHVSCVIGSNPYRQFAEKWSMPVVICGFEPLDMLLSIRMLIDQVNDARHEVENEFTRAVTAEGNTLAQHLVDEVFELRESFEWRGLGAVPHSALRIRDTFAEFDAERKFDLHETPVADNKACACGAILRGEKTPPQCPLFGKVCTPARPIGACMVSSEGACAAFWRYAPKSKKENQPCP